jgi:hypothetical protein
MTNEDYMWPLFQKSRDAADGVVSSSPPFLFNIRHVDRDDDLHLFSTSRFTKQPTMIVLSTFFFNKTVKALPMIFLSSALPSSLYVQKRNLHQHMCALPPTKSNIQSGKWVDYITKPIRLEPMSSYGLRLAIGAI